MAEERHGSLDLEEGHPTFESILHAADGIIHQIGLKVHLVHEMKLTDAVVGFELGMSLTHAVLDARKGDWEKFGDDMAETSLAAANYSAVGIPGLIQALHDELAQLASVQGSGPSVQETINTVLHSIQDDIVNGVFEVNHPRESEPFTASVFPTMQPFDGRIVQEDAPPDHKSSGHGGAVHGHHHRAENDSLNGGNDAGFGLPAADMILPPYIVTLADLDDVVYDPALLLSDGVDDMSGVLLSDTPTSDTPGTGFNGGDIHINTITDIAVISELVQWGHADVAFASTVAGTQSPDSLAGTPDFAGIHGTADLGAAPDFGVFHLSGDHFQPDWGAGMSAADDSLSVPYSGGLDGGF